jgi:hypothetical protein
MINFISGLNVVGDSTFADSITMLSVVNAGTDTNKFLVLSSSGVVNFRTGAELASDIGAGTGTVTGSGTATRVAFWDGESGASTALTSNANLFWDNTNDRLGIGTASPTQNLEVNGGFQAKSVLLKLNGTSTSKKYLQIDGGGGSGSVSGQAAVGFRPIGAGTNVHASIEGLENGNGSYTTNMTFNTNGSNSDSAPTERMRITSAGNVGIGTTSPSEKLQVNGTVRATSYKSSDGSAGVTSTFTVRNGNNSASLTFVIKNGIVTSVSSDRRLKENITLIGTSDSGINIYTYEYKYKFSLAGVGLFQGVMSDEVPAEAVSVDEHGYDMVDYSLIDVEFKRLSN